VLKPNVFGLQSENGKKKLELALAMTRRHCLHALVASGEVSKAGVAAYHAAKKGSMRIRPASWRWGRRSRPEGMRQTSANRFELAASEAPVKPRIFHRTANTHIAA
jgi:hypothetical protein